MIKKVFVIDYGAGNLKSIVKALKVLDLEVQIVDAHKLSSNFKNLTDLLVLPGVGEFGSAAKVLNKVRDNIVEYVRNGKPLLGICLGIQLLFDKSEENRSQKGLGIVPGEVVRFNFKKLRNKINLPVPHMCWNKVKFLKTKNVADKRKVILKNLNQEEFFYFVHSYYPVPKEKKIIFGTTEYGIKFCSMIVKDNIVATQFHLEKSGNKGLVLLKNVVNYFEKL